MVFMKKNVHSVGSCRPSKNEIVSEVQNRLVITCFKSSRGTLQINILMLISSLAKSEN